MSLALSWGRYGGFYLLRRLGCFRICLGWVALTWLDIEIDDVMRMAVEPVTRTEPAE